MGWDYFFCEVDGERATMAVDLSVTTPQTERPHLVYLRIFPSTWSKVTLEPDEEMRLFDEIETFVDRIAALHDAVYVGRATTSSTRSYVLYAPEGKYLRRWLQCTFVTLAEYGYDHCAGTGPDPDWSVYRDFLSPGPNEQAAIAAGRALRA